MDNNTTNKTTQQDYINSLRKEINNLITENEDLKRMLSSGKKNGLDELNRKYKNYELFTSQEDIGEITEDVLIAWDPENISKNTKASENPNNKTIYARDYDLDWLDKRVEVKSSLAKKYFKDEKGKWRQRYHVTSDYEGSFRFSAKNIRMNGLWEYLIFVVYYLDTEVLYLFRYDEMNSESLGVTLSPLNINQSKNNNNYQFTITHLSLNKLDKFKKTKEEIMKILGEDYEKEKVNKG